MAFWIYKDSANQWRWYLAAANNKKIADSGAGLFLRNPLFEVGVIAQAHSEAPSTG